MELEGGLSGLIIKGVYLKNIKSYREEKVDFEEGVNAVSGENGAGKTTILEAIGYALFDYLPFPQEKFIRRGCDEGKVVVEFLLNGSMYKVTRKCKASDHYLTTGQGDRELVSGVNDVKRWVSEKIVSVDKSDLDKVFSNAIGVPQGKYTSSFLESKAARQKIFDPILGVDDYRDAYDRLRGPKKMIEEKKRDLKEEIIELKGKTSDISKKKKKKEELNQELQEKQENLRNEKKSLKEFKEKENQLKEKKEKIRNLRTDLREINNRVSDLREEKKKKKKELSEAKEAKEIVNSLENKKNEFEEVKEKLSNLKKQKRELEGKKDKKNKLKTNLAKLSEKKDSLKKEIKDIKKAESDLDKTKEEKRRFDELNSKKEELNTDIKSLNREKSDLMDKKNNSALKKGICPIFDEIECTSVTDMKDYFSEKISSINEELRELKEKKEKVCEKLERFEVDPNKKLAILQEKANKKENKVNELNELNKEIDNKKSKIKNLNKELEDFEEIKEDIEKLESKREELEEFSKKYERKIEIANSFKEKKKDFGEIKEKLETKKEKKKELKEELSSLLDSYSEETHEKIKEKNQVLRDEVVSIKRDIENTENRLNELKEEISELKKLINKKEKKEEELEKVNDFFDFFEFTRSTLRDAAPHIAEAFVERITGEADQFYKEITDDYGQKLEWDRNYEVIIKKRGREKSFNQLSGGEKMAAAISIRLALLKTISESRIVFLDEPTENMDEIRREKLADKIQEIDGFNQIFVISHDDTFNSAIENITEIEKEDGVSKVKEIGV